MFEKFYKIGNFTINPKNINCITEQSNGKYSLYMKGCDTVFELTKRVGETLLWRLDIEEIDLED